MSDNEKKLSEFLHDLSTPLVTAKLNAELLNEYHTLLKEALALQSANHIPEHLKQALLNTPEVICQNINQMQTLLTQYKNSASAPQPTSNTSEDAATMEDAAPSLEIKPSGPFEVLLVDDEKIHHDIAQAVLGELHYLRHANSGEEAITRCQDQAFDVILMDLQMPSLTGQETVLKLKEVLKSQSLIIGLSNMPIQAHKQELLNSGFHGFLDKPLRIEDFDTLIKALYKITK